MKYIVMSCLRTELAFCNNSGCKKNACNGYSNSSCTGKTNVKVKVSVKWLEESVMKYVVSPVDRTNLAFCNGCSCKSGNCNCKGGNSKYKNSQSATVK